MTQTTTLEAIRYHRGKLAVLDQLLLPHQTVYRNVTGSADGRRMVEQMSIRGAPAIAIASMLSLAVELTALSPTSLDSQFPSISAFLAYLKSQLEYLKESRPTAVNLSIAATTLYDIAAQAALQPNASVQTVLLAFVEGAENMLAEDVKSNRAIGVNGSDYLWSRRSSRKWRVLTHCNTGSLATAGWGTALGIIRQLFYSDRLDRVYCTETRPYNQGSRLTAYELVHDGIPSTLMTDSMCASAMAAGQIDTVIVGADRIASNGDTANKIGTLMLAVTAHHYGIPFIVAAPTTSIDPTLKDGSGIVIEQRSPHEITHIQGALMDGKQEEGARLAQVKIAANGIQVMNPAFDVTPASLITAIVTEKKAHLPNANSTFTL